MNAPRWFWPVAAACLVIIAWGHLVEMEWFQKILP